MQMNPIMEAFYVSILDYSGLKLQDNIIVQKNEKLGEFTIDGKHICLPYMELLKNPQDKLFFHLLNENYVSPETTLFTQFKNRLVLELNLRLTSLVTSLIALSSDVMLQQRIKSSNLINLVTEVGETDHSVIEGFLAMVKASSKQNKEGYIVDIFLKKNGEVNNTPYAAIGKLNFRLYEEVKKALDSSEKDYRVFGTKLRKKDLMTVYNVLRAIFTEIDTKDSYSEGTDNKIFRYLNILLKTSYQISERMNQIADWLDEVGEPSLNVADIRGNHDWVEPIQKLQGMATEIRLIPNQTDSAVEAKRLVIDESKAVNPPAQPAQPPSFNPTMVTQTTMPSPQPQPQQVPQQQPAQQQVMQQPLTPEEIIRNKAAGNMGMQPMMPNMMPNMMPGMMPGMQMPGMMMPGMTQQPAMTPSWVQAELIKNQLQQIQQQPMQQDPNMALLQQQMAQQAMLQQQMAQQAMLAQQQQNMMMPNMMPNMGMQGMMMPGMGVPQQGGIQLNPAFMGQRAGLQV